MTDSINIKKLSGIPPGRCIHTTEKECLALVLLGDDAPCHGESLCDRDQFGSFLRHTPPLPIKLPELFLYSKTAASASNQWRCPPSPSRVREMGSTVPCTKLDAQYPL